MWSLHFWTWTVSGCRCSEGYKTVGPLTRCTSYSCMNISPFLWFWDTDTWKRNTHIPEPAACCCWPDSLRAARLSRTASSKSAGWSVVQAMTLAAGSSISAGLSWHGDIWPRSISGSDQPAGRNPVLTALPIFQARFMSWSFTNVLFPHAGSLRHVYRCLAWRAEQSELSIVVTTSSLNPSTQRA